MIAAGFGFRGAATVESLRDALERAAAGRPVTLLAAPADKADADALRSLAGALGVPVVAVAAAELAATDTPSRSARVLAARGTGCVAEAAALVAAGRAGPARLLGPRVVSADRLATCAIAVGAIAVTGASP